MKTDRRHELQTNVLADWIGKHLQRMQGYSQTIVAVLLLAVAGVIAGTFWMREQASSSQASWNQFFQAFGERNPVALQDAAKSNEGSTAGVWAHLAAADLKLAEGVGDLYTNRDNANKNLAEAERNYLVVDGTSTEKLLRERAWFGLGQVYESMSKLDKAKQFYGKLASSSPTSALGKEARLRAEALDDASTAKWYNWFANQTPRPAIPGMSGDLGLPSFPRDLGNLSDRPDLSIPELPPVGPGSAATPQTTDLPGAGPELNSPAPLPVSTPAASANPEGADATPGKPGTPAATEAPQAPTSTEPSSTEPAPESSEAPAERSSAPGEDSPE